MVDNAVLLQTLAKAVRTSVSIGVFEGAHHVLPASVPLDDLVGRIDHWFTAPEAELAPRLVVERIPPAPQASPVRNGH
jgi:hypothetical protein